jgi:hypothetical protein
MAFVPVVPPQRPASARAQDLGRRLKAEVEKFEAQYPGTSREDRRAAAALAIGEESHGRVAPRRAVAAVVGFVGALYLIGVGAWVSQRVAGSAGRTAMAISIIAGGAILVTTLVRLRRQG